MSPVLIKLGPITIYTFGLSLFLAILAGSFLVWKSARTRGLSEEKIFDLFLLTVFVGFIGARVGYVISQWSLFSTDLSRIVLFTHYPGFSFTSGFISGLIVLFLLARLMSLDALLVLDVFSLAFSWSITVALLGAGSQTKQIVAFLIMALTLTVFKHKIDSDPNLTVLARRGGLFASAYLIFLSASFLIDSKIYWILLLIFGCLFMVKFPTEVLQQIRKYLEEKRQDAERRLRALKKDDPFEDKSRLLDRASDDTEAQSKAGHERIAAMQQQLNGILIQTRKALTKIKIGKYGVCENCGKMIDTDRLAAMPTATLCLNCEKKRERK